MRKDIIIVDELLPNVDDIRASALRLPYTLEGNYPGVRTNPCMNRRLKSLIQLSTGLDVTNWHDDTYCGSYQAISGECRTWIHADRYNDWAGILYLNPDPLPGSGTEFWSYDRAGAKQSRWIGDNVAEPGDPKWYRTDYVENVYNRLVVYRGDLFHKAGRYFGSPSDLSTQRLTQVFFFDTRE